MNGWQIDLVAAVQVTLFRHQEATCQWSLWKPQRCSGNGIIRNLCQGKKGLWDKCARSKWSIFEHLQLRLIAWCHSFLQWVKCAMINSGSSGTDIDIPEGSFKNNKVAVFLCRAQRQAAVQQLKNFTLLHNYWSCWSGRRVSLQGKVNQTICYYFWNEAATYLTLSCRPFVSCEQCKTHAPLDAAQPPDVMI